MSATILHYPINPHVNQVYLAPNGISYVFNGSVWRVSSVSSNTPTPVPPPPVVNQMGITGPVGPAGPTGTPGTPGPTGPGLNAGIAANLIPAVGNVYSLGDSTHWWKDVWLSANTLYIGGAPITTTGGQLSVNSLSINPNTTYGYSQNSASEIYVMVDPYNSNVPIMVVNNPNADFVNNIKKVKIGDKYTAKFSDPVTGTLSDKTLTFKQLPYWGASNLVPLFWQWEISETDPSLLGEYASITLDSLKVLLVGTTPITPIGGGISVPGVTIPNTLKSFGPHNNTAQAINSDNGIFWTENSSPEFNTALDLLKVGDTYQITLDANSSFSGQTVTYTCTIQTPPRTSFLQYHDKTSRMWHTVEDQFDGGQFDYMTFLTPGQLMIGNMPISTSSGSILVPNLSVSGTLTTVGTGINPQDTQTPVRFTYVFDVVDHNFYAGFAGIPNAPVGQISITDDSAWPPPTGNYQTNGGGYIFSFSMSSTDSAGNDVHSHLSKLSDGGWGSKSIYMTMKDATDSSKYTIFFIFIATISPGDITYQFNCKYITGTVGHAYFVSHSASNKIKVELEFSGTTMGGKIPLNTTQQYWWQDSAYGTGAYFATEGYPSLGTASSRSLPLACSTLELHPQSSNAGVLGSVTLPNSAEFNGRSINVIIRGNSMSKSSFLNVTGASLSSTIAANTMFTAIFSTASNRWTVTNVITNM